jgi:hypothetical protein
MFNLDAMKMRLLELEIVVQEARGVENITKRKVTDLRYTIDQLKEANIACDCTRIKVELDEAHSLYVSQVTTSSDAEEKATHMRIDIGVLEAHILATETAVHVSDIEKDSLRLYMTAMEIKDNEQAHKMADFYRMEPEKHDYYYLMHLGRIRDKTAVSLKMFSSMVRIASDATNERNETKELLAKEIAAHASTQVRLAKLEDRYANTLTGSAQKRMRLD